jgi:hypothetical protein
MLILDLPRAMRVEIRPVTTAPMAVAPAVASRRLSVPRRAERHHCAFRRDAG